MKIDIEKLVNRFLGWPLPKTFAPDCGISFTKLNHPTSWPIGTNLLTAEEARQMFEHVLDVGAATADTGIDLIAAERARQIEQEGWTPEHDAEHDKHELAWAAICYAAPEWIYRETGRHIFGGDGYVFSDPWPWDRQSDKRPRDFIDVTLRADEQSRDERIRCLVKAGALIAAEIDRLRHAATKKTANVPSQREHGSDAEY
jgi:hypothetical protein